MTRIEFNHRLIIVVSIIALIMTFFVSKMTQNFADYYKLSFDFFWFLLIFGYTLWYKKLLQLIGLFIATIGFNVDLCKNVLWAATGNLIDILITYKFIISLLLVLVYLPTLFDKFTLKPLTNRMNISD